VVEGTLVKREGSEKDKAKATLKNWTTKMLEIVVSFIVWVGHQTHQV
jgi:hypothetical protein